MTKYLVSCECGQSVAVETTQAGEDVMCSCGRKVGVPALRALRQLPRVEVVPEKPPSSGWSPVHGAVFAAGSLLAVCGLLVGAYALIQESRLDVPGPSEAEVQQWIERIDLLSMEEQWALWVESRDNGLPPGIAPLARLRQAAVGYRRLASIGLGAALFGLLLCTSAWLMGRPHQRQPQPVTDASRARGR